MELTLGERLSEEEFLLTIFRFANQVKIFRVKWVQSLVQRNSHASSNDCLFQRMFRILQFYQIHHLASRNFSQSFSSSIFCNFAVVEQHLWSLLLFSPLLPILLFFAVTLAVFQETNPRPQDADNGSGIEITTPITPKCCLWFLDQQSCHHFGDHVSSKWQNETGCSENGKTINDNFAVPLVQVSPKLGASSLFRSRSLFSQLKATSGSGGNRVP